MTRFALLLVAGLAWACTSAPTRFYTLQGPAPAPGVRELAGPTLAVGPVALPEALDRPQVVTQRAGGEVRVDEFARWAAPLRSEIARVLAEQLAALRPDARIAPFGAAPAAPDLRILLDVRRFALAPGEGATLDAVWTLAATGKTLRTARSVIVEPAREAGIDALVAAQSRAVERLARDIAAALPAAQANAASPAAQGR